VGGGVSSIDCDNIPPEGLVKVASILRLYIGS